MGTHCNHALTHLREAQPPSSYGLVGALRLAVQLIEAKALRRTSSKGEPSRTGDARSVVVLCDVGLQCYQEGCSRPSNSHASHSTLDDSSLQQEMLPNKIDAEQ